MDFGMRRWRNGGWLIVAMALGCYSAKAQDGAAAPPAAVPVAAVQGAGDPPAPAAVPAPTTPAVAPETPAAAPATTEAVVAAKPPADPAPADSDARKSGADDLISMTVSDARIQDVLRSLAAMRPGVNLIMGPEVQGAVSFALKDVTWDVALQLVTESNGFLVTKESDNIYRIRKPEAPVKSDIVVELMGKADVGLVPVDELLRMTASLSPAAPLSVEKAREELAKAPNRYLKSLQVQSKPAVEVVNELAKKANLNFAFSTDLGTLATAAPAPGGQPPAALPPQTLPPVSINLRYVSVVDALNLVSAQGGLACSQQNGVWVVKPMPPQQLQLEPLKMETFDVKFMPVDDEVIKLLKSLLTTRGTVSSGKNKVIVVRDTNEGLESVRKALEAMDKSTPQVMIEARFFQVTAADSKNLGVDWSALGKSGIGVSTSPLHMAHGENITTTNTTTSGTPASQTTGSTESIIQDVATGVITGTKTTTTNTAAATADSGIVQRVKEVTNARTAVLDMAQFGVTLHALLTDSNVKQLSNPKIVVSSDEQATIHIGPQTPIIKSTAEAGSAGGGTVRTFELDPDYGGETIQEEQLLPSGQTKTSRSRSYTTRKGYLDTGTRLTVAPSVKTEDQIYLKVVPELTTLGDFVTVGSGDSQVSFPNLFTTRVSTDFTIRSGQTIAIGGLVSEQTTRSESGVPVLRSIPLLKRLFSWEQESKTQTETIIFLTVKILPAEKLTATSGVPVRAYLVQSELDQIAKEDALGAEYQPSSARERIRKLEKEAEEKNWTPAQFKKSLKESFSGGTAKATDPAPAAAVTPTPAAP